ncbi:Uncharacterised protein [Serratia fonticola]|nr:Uncharacterised protein [Serratia fonticola]CAI1220499.1 Uncharacterised protein [Serratia fonticola]
MEFIIPNLLFQQPNQQKVNFAWGVVIFVVKSAYILNYELV